jgi:glutamate 5-kinase
MASGIKKIGLPKRPDEIPKRQAAAAVGQAGLIMEYEKSFARYKKKLAQMLLTSDGLTNRKKILKCPKYAVYLVIMGCCSIINENDTVQWKKLNSETMTTWLP